MSNVKYTKELLEEAVSASKCWADVCRWFGVKPSTGAQSHITRRAKDFEVNTSHFTGQGHRKNLGKRKHPVEYYLVSGKRTSSHRLKLRLIEEGLKEAICEVCERDEWMGQPIPIELDHIDGDHENNELSNLRIICPNCHAQTDTHAGKNRE